MIWQLTLFAVAVVPAVASAEIVLESGQLRLAIEEDGTVKSLASIPDGIEYLAPGPPRPLAVVYRGGRAVPLAEGKYAAVTDRWQWRGGLQFAATRVSRRGDTLTIEFGDADVTAHLGVRCTEEYTALELLSVEGGAVDRIELVRLKVRKLPRFGQWASVARDDRFGICLCAGNLQTNAEVWRQDDAIQMTAAAEAAVGFRGATAVLFGCGATKEEFLDRMAKVERDFQLPAGAKSRRSPLQRLSYFWASRPTPENIEEYILWAKRGGFRVLLFSYTAFSKGPGHFEWNESYPNGMADLTRVTDAIRRAGLQPGLHIHYSKAGKRDPYVTPAPDDRLHKVRTFTLAADVEPDVSTIPVLEDPAGCTLDDGRRLLKLGKELVEYQAFAAQPPYEFRGCRRGQLDSLAGRHVEGSEAALLDVDTWPAFIRLDQETDVQDEVAGRIAEIYRRTGPYAMVYFDGAEDVHEPFWHHVASAQHRVFRLLDPPPAVCESAHYTHLSWHMITRSNAYDVVAPPEGMKDFCRLMPCPTAAARELDFSRIQFGWLGRFGRSKAGCAGPDVFEYIASRAAAWDCPISLHASLEEIGANPRADDCLAAIKTWEDARLGGHLSDADREILKNVAPADAHYVSCYQQRDTYQRSREGRGLTDAQRRILADRREHHLLLDEQGRYELVQIEPVPLRDDAIKGYLFRRKGSPEDTYVLAWAAEGQVSLRLPMAEDRLVVMRPFGRKEPVRRSGGAYEIVLGPRVYLVFRDMNPDAVREILRRST